MRVQSLLKYNINFLSKKHNKHFDTFEENSNIHSFVQYEDSDFILRKKIRAHMLDQFMPINYFEKNDIDKYASCLEDTTIRNLQKLAVGCYSGASLNNPVYFDLLKTTGIKTVIDLAGNNSLKQSCIENNINYYAYKVNFDYWGNPIFRTNEELISEIEQELIKHNTQKNKNEKTIEYYNNHIKEGRENFIKDFANLIKVINGRSFYICCDLGEYRTPNILALNSFFNPKWNGKVIYPTNFFIYEKIKNMYNNLTANDKILLEFTKKHEDFLKKELFSKFKQTF